MTTFSSLDFTAFSHPGAWFSFGRGIGHQRWDEGPGAHLVHHFGNTRPVARLEVHDDAGRAAEAHRVGAVLRFAAPGGAVEIVYPDARTVLLRGRRASLVLSTGAGIDIFRLEDGRAVITSFESRCRFVVHARQGTLRVETPAKAGNEGVSRLVVEGDSWDISIRERTGSTMGDSTLVEFAGVAAAADRADREWASRFVPDDERRTGTVADAARLLRTCVVDPRGSTTRRTVLMSKNWMSRVWSWDHCFTALALVRVDPALAWEQMFTILDHQDADGALPDFVDGQAPVYTYVKPPIHGWAVRRMLDAAPDSLDAAGRDALAEHLSRWTLWWLRERTLPGEVLPRYFHGNDSGWDNSTAFDHGLPLVTPDLPAYLVIQCEVVAELREGQGRSAEAVVWRDRAAAITGELDRRLLRGGDVSVERLGTPLPTTSLLAAMPLVLGHRLSAPVLDALCGRMERHLLDRGLATELPDSGRFEVDGYWRGPMWAPVTYLLVDGLRDAGRHALADRVAERFVATVERCGFAENFDVVHGRGLRDPGYTWTAAAYLLLTSSAAVGGSVVPVVPESVGAGSTEHQG
ncbi:MAG: amylo-alpha-1,6-glucosidase [Dermatophilaceae bacterium]